MSKYKIPDTKPFGYSYYPYELYPIPKSWAATTGDLTFFRAHDEGGHFAAFEQTETFLKNLEEFVQENRGAAGFFHLQRATILPTNKASWRYGCCVTLSA